MRPFGHLRRALLARYARGPLSSSGCAGAPGGEAQPIDRGGGACAEEDKEAEEEEPLRVGLEGSKGPSSSPTASAYARQTGGMELGEIKVGEEPEDHVVSKLP